VATSTTMPVVYFFQDNASDGTLRPTYGDQHIVFNNSISYGSNVPDWRRRIAQGDSATTSAIGVYLDKFRDKSSTLTASVKSPPGPYAYNVTYVTNSGYAGTVASHLSYTYTPSVYDSALVAFVSRAREAQYRFQSGTFFGELRQTINLLRRPLRGIGELTSNYHRRVKRHAPGKRGRKLHKFLADEWLTYSFGIVPLVADIDDLMHDLAVLTVGRPKLAPVRGRAFGKELRTSVSYSGLISYWLQSTTETVSTEEDVVVRGAVRVILPDASSNWLGSDNLKQAMSDFVPTLWNLIPYSFLIDYVSNVGDVLSGLSFNSATVSWANSTKRIKVIGSRTLSWSQVPDRYGAAWVPDNIKESEKSITGIAITKRWERGSVSSFIPSFHWNLPTHARQIANTIALIFSSRSVK